MNLDISRKQLIILFSALFMLSAITTIWLFGLTTTPKSELDLLLKDYTESHPDIEGLKCKIDYNDDGSIKERNCRRPDSTLPNVFKTYDIQAPHVDSLEYIDHVGLEISEIDYCVETTGASMRPTLFTGNTVCFIKYNKWMKYDLREGMIIRFSYDGKTMIHRIYTFYPDYLITKGDNNKGSEAIDYQDIKGVAVAILFT